MLRRSEEGIGFAEPMLSRSKPWIDMERYKGPATLIRGRAFRLVLSSPFPDFISSCNIRVQDCGTLGYPGVSFLNINRKGKKDAL